mgnify:CR=1 FL=1
MTTPTWSRRRMQRTGFGSVNDSSPHPGERQHQRRCRVSMGSSHAHRQPALPMDPSSSGLTLATVLLAGSGLFVLATLFFGTKGGYYDTDQYDGNGTAH